MRAAVQWEAGKPLEVEEVTPLGVGAGEVRVKVGASGVCHSDLSMKNSIRPLGSLPGVHGHEGAGTVIEVGEGVTALAEGDHVILSWIAPCGACKDCFTGQSYRCRTGRSARAFKTPRYTVRGVNAYATQGLATFAEECVVNYRAAIKIDADVPMDVAALIGCGVMTGVGSALNVAKVQPGSSVVVIGCGGVGMSAIQGARIAGAAEILAVDTVPGKLEIAKRFGASHVATPEQLDDSVASITGKGFDYGLEALGRPETVKMTWDATRAGGLVVIIGVGERIMSQIPMAELGSKTLATSLYGNAEVRVDFERMIRLWRTGRLDLEGMITRRIDLTEINDAFDAMERGEGVRSVINYR